MVLVGFWIRICWFCCFIWLYFGFWVRVIFISIWGFCFVFCLFIRIWVLVMVVVVLGVSRVKGVRVVGLFGVVVGF